MKENVRRNLKKIELCIKQHSPEILTAIGVVTSVAAVYTAAKKTADLDEKLEPVKDKIVEVKAEDELDKKELTKCYAQAAGVVVKNYAQPIIFEAVSLSAFLASYGIMKKRNVALVAAYGALDNLFKTYRQNVVEELGEEKDYMFLHSLKKEKIEVEEEDPETGKKKKVKKEVFVKKDCDLSMYSKLFDASNRNYKDSPLLNRAFIKGVETWANQKLRADGYLFLSDVLLALGFEQTPASRVVGWMWDDSCNAETNTVDLGIFDKINGMVNEAANLNDNLADAEYWIDFNVDGVIVDVFQKDKLTNPSAKACL